MRLGEALVFPPPLRAAISTWSPSAYGFCLVSGGWLRLISVTHTSLHVQGRFSFPPAPSVEPSPHAEASSRNNASQKQAKPLQHHALNGGRSSRARLSRLSPVHSGASSSKEDSRLSHAKKPSAPRNNPLKTYFFTLLAGGTTARTWVCGRTSWTSSSWAR